MDRMLPPARPFMQESAVRGRIIRGLRAGSLDVGKGGDMGKARKLAFALAMAGSLLGGAAQAALIDRGGGLIYDDVLNITWLADGNYARTSGYDADGLMNFATATRWAADLVYAGYTDWRLPSARRLLDGGPPCISIGSAICNNSEMGHMYYNNLGAIRNNTGDGILAGTNTANLALVLPQSYIYWTSTEIDEEAAWFFRTEFGIQSYTNRNTPAFAWAVRSGDVIPAIPLPGSQGLLLAGLALLAACRRCSGSKRGTAS